MNKAVAAFRQDHGRGDNDTRYQPKSGRWTPGCNQKDPQDICERRQASRPPVVSPFPEEIQG